VLQESPDELQGRQRHQSPLALSAFLIAERYLAIIDTDQSAVGEGNPVDVPCEVLQDPFGPLHGRTTINPPPLGPDGIREFLLRQCLSSHLEEYSPKDQRQRLDWHQVVLAGG
jgi:hypothetical protein